MKKETTIDKIEIDASGTIGVRFACQVLDDEGTVVVNHWHRTAIPPGVDVDEQMAAVAAHLAIGLSVGQSIIIFPAVDDLSELKAIVAIVHAPERIETYRKLIVDKS